MDANLPIPDSEQAALLSSLGAALLGHTLVRWPGLGTIERLERRLPGAGQLQFFVLGFRPDSFLVQALRLRPPPSEYACEDWVDRFAAALELGPDEARERLEQLARAAGGRILALGGVVTPIGNFAKVTGERVFPGGEVEQVSFVEYWPEPGFLAALQPDEAAIRAAASFYQLKAQRMQERSEPAQVH